MQDGTSVLHLKMVHTVLKVPDDCKIMCTHGFNFSKNKHVFQIKAKLEDLKRGKQTTEHHNKVIKKCSALNSAPRQREM